MDEIKQLIREEKDPRKRKILVELKSLCAFADDYMLKPYIPWKNKYRGLQHTPQWRKARKLMKRYFIKDNILKCPICTFKIKDGFTMHHDMYGKPITFFNPLYVQLIHHHCHKRIYMEK